MRSITIIGPGAIGGTVAAWLAQDVQNEIALCARTSFGKLTVDTPHGRLVAAPRIFTMPEQATQASWVFVATKAYDAATAAHWFPALIGPSTRVAVLQNGVEHLERFSPFITPERLVPVVVDLPAERRGPGNIWQRSDGHLIVPDNDNGREFVRLFAATSLTAATAVDFRTQAWRKLVFNCTGVVPALLLRSVDVERQPEMAGLMRELIREGIRVGRAEGAVLDDMLEEEIIARYRKSPANAVNSLHADRLAGRPTEIDARNGAVVRIGQRHAIDTPMNRLMVALFTAAAQR